MGKIEKAITWMESLANDNSHGYDQANRWGPDYDCSSAVITAWEKAGVPVKTNGATYTGNIYSVFTKLGFKDVTKQCDLSTGAGMKRGDVLLNHVNHVAMYCGNGKKVEASGNEKGGITGGKTGDQTGTEIRIITYSNYWDGWDCILRYSETENTDATSMSGTVKTESSGSSFPSYDPKWKAEVNVDDFLCVRTWPGTENRTLYSVPFLYPGDIIEVCDSATGSDGCTWFFVKIPYDGYKCGYVHGFVHGDYITKVKT